MARRPRRTHSPKLKAKVALAAIVGDKTIAELAVLQYSPAECTGVKKVRVTGNPDIKKVSTSYVERSNLTIRMQNRRFTRLTNAFSKKFDNHVHAFSLFAMHYNYCKIHKTLRATPAMEAGLTGHAWSHEEVIGLLREKEQPKKRGSYKKQVKISN